MAADAGPDPYTSPIVTFPDLQLAQDRARAARAAVGRSLVLLGGGLAGGLAAVRAIVGGRVAGTVGAVLGVVLGIVLAAGAVAWLVNGAHDRLVGRLDGTEVDDTDEPRILTLVEGLAATVGVSPPPVVVLDDPAGNAGLVGVGRPPTLVVTRGLLDGLDRLALEGVVAPALHRAASAEYLAESTAAGVVGWLAPSLGRRLAGPGRRLDDALALDAEAVQHTRYPPGLAAALDRVDALPVQQRATLGVSWMIDPGERGRADVPTRVAALHER